MYNETKTAVAGNPKVTLKYAANPSTRNRVVIWKIAGGIEPVEIVDAPAAGRPVRQAQLAGTTLTFADPLNAGDKVDVTYVLKAVVNVKLTLGALTESYLVHDGNMLVSDIQNPESPSSLVTAVAGDKPDEAPKEQKATFIGGANGKAFRDYLNAQTYAPLLDVDAHIIVAAGQNDRTAGAGLDQHCQKASTDEYKRDRIAVVGSKRASGTSTEQIVGFVNELIGNTLASDRLVFVTPGIVATSSAPEDQKYNPITLPGAYAAAAIAGMLAATPPHVSLTNKPVAVADVEVRFTNAQLEELVQNRVTALEMDRGFRVLRGQTTDSGPFREITTRRIVDYAKYGVRSAAAPFIGLLNNERVRSALRASINSFLQSMLDGEMLVSYGIDVTATRDQQIRGIVQVTIALQPVFSINFIQVTMILS
jgi:hypothetical protein